MRNYTRDEGGPFEFSNQVLISSHRKLLRSRAVVVSVAEIPGRGSRQAWSREASASKPSMKCRKRIRRCQNRGVTLVWGLSRSFDKMAHLFSFISFFVRSESPFLRSDLCFAHLGARKSWQGWPSHQPLRHVPLLSGHTSSAFEHDCPAWPVGMTIRGEPAFGRGSIAPQPCIR